MADQLPEPTVAAQPGPSVTDWVRGDWREALITSLARLERHLDTVRERPMRRTVVCDAVLALEGPGLVAFLGLLLERSRAGNGRARAVLQELALEPHVFRDIPYARLQEAYRVARGCGADEVAEMFLSARQERNPTIHEAFTGNEHLDLPLGVRRSAARTRDRNTLDRLVHDRDHRVIQLLLDNPRLVERDAVRIAAMRPQRPEVLSVVARHRRWSSRYPVRKALACNPYTPAPVARKLLPTLLRQDLRFAVESGALGPELREEARRVLHRKPGEALPGFELSGALGEDADGVALPVESDGA